MKKHNYMEGTYDLRPISPESYDLADLIETRFRLIWFTLKNINPISKIQVFKLSS